MNIYAQRLLNVARALRESPNPDKFDMGDMIHTCGTPACAWGHYACRTDLQNVFKPKLLEGYGGNFWDIVSVVKDSVGSPWDSESQEHFGLNEEELDELFDSDGCGEARTASEAADYIQQFVERKWPIETLIASLSEITTDEPMPEPVAI